VSVARVTPRALADLDAIAGWSLRQWGDARTEIYLRDLADRFDWLAANPQLGRDRAEVGAGYRSFPQGRHVVFYVAVPEGIAIIGVPHQAMDVADYFDSDG
jgi:toxin ParE1/3/4